VITERSMWTHYEGLRTTFANKFLTRHLKNRKKSRVLKSEKKNVKSVLSSTAVGGRLWSIRHIGRAMSRYCQSYSLGGSSDAAFRCHYRSSLIGDFKICRCVDTGAPAAIKPEATAIGIIARWPLENNLNVWWAHVVHTEIQIFYVTADNTSLVVSDVLLRRSCFAVIG